MNARKPVTPFNFTEALLQSFRTEGGADFGKRLFLSYAAIIVVIFLVAMPVLMPLYFDLLDASWVVNQATFSGETADPAAASQMFSAISKVLPAYLLLLLICWLASASAETALHRQNLLGVSKPGWPLSFGRDELRTMVVQFLVFVIWASVYSIGIILLVIIGLAASAISSGLAAIVIVFGIIFYVCIMVLIPIRLAPAAALTVYNDKLTLGSAFHVTKHRFWNLFMTYLVCVIGAYIALNVVIFVVVMAVVGDSSAMMAISGLGSELPSSVFEAVGARLKNPLVMLIIVLGGIAYSAISVLITLTLAGIGSYAAKWYLADDPDAQTD